MIDSITYFLELNLGTGDIGLHVVVFLLSMFPAISGPAIAIPIGAALGLPPVSNAVASIVGNIMPIPIILLLLRKIFNFMRRVSSKFGKVVDYLEEKAKSRSSRFKYGEFFGIMLFVAIPLPLPAMGAWTGALIGVVFDVRLKIALPAIAAGVVIAGIITTIITYGAVTIFG